MNFRVGQKVVFIGWPEEGEDDWEGDEPIEGEVYTVAAIYPWEGTIEIAELAAPATDEYSPGYDIKCFRPAVEPDISIFLKMLEPSPKKLEPVT